MMKFMGPEHDDNVFSPTDLNLLNWSSLEFQIFLLHQKTSHCRLLTWIQEELHMQLTKHTSMVVYMFLHFINLKFLQYKIKYKRKLKKKMQQWKLSTKQRGNCHTTLSPKKTMTIIITKNRIQFLYKQHVFKYHFNVGNEIDNLKWEAMCSGLKIMAGQRTMSTLDGIFVGQKLHLPVM